MRSCRGTAGCGSRPRWCGSAVLPDGADAMTRTVTEEARATGERMLTEFGLVVESYSLAHQGKVAAARARE